LIALDQLRETFEEAMAGAMSDERADMLPAATVVGLIGVHFAALPAKLTPLIETAVKAVVSIWSQITPQLVARVPNTTPEALRLDIAPAAANASQAAPADAATQPQPQEAQGQQAQPQTELVDEAGRFLSAVLAVEVVERACAPIAPYTPVPRFRFHRFGLRTGSPFLGPETWQDKLFGLRLGHFGAFLRKSWRAYDWMWGRLDGATHLTTMLFEPTTLRHCFSPDVPDAEYTRRVKALARFTGRSDTRTTLDQLREDTVGALTPAQVRLMVTPLREAAQHKLHRQILIEELPWFAKNGNATVKPATKQVLDTLETPTEENLSAALRGVRDDINITPTALADSDQGHVVVGEMASATLRALSKDKRLPASGSTSGMLRAAATVVRIATQNTPTGRAFRGFVFALVLLFAVSPLWAPRVPSSIVFWVFRIVCTVLFLGLSVLFVPLMPRWLRRVIRPAAWLAGKVPKGLRP
jgi:hypothetical protein